MLPVGKPDSETERLLKFIGLPAPPALHLGRDGCLPGRLRTSTIGLGDKCPSETNIGVASLHDQALDGLATKAGTQPGVSKGEEKMRAAIQRLQGDGAVAESIPTGVPNCK